MIYLFFLGIYEHRECVGVYEAPEGVDISKMAFLRSLGLRPRPSGNPHESGSTPESRASIAKDMQCWYNERCALLKENGITAYEEGEDEAHWEWVKAHPQVKSLPFKEVG